MDIETTPETKMVLQALRDQCLEMFHGGSGIQWEQAADVLTEAFNLEVTE